MPGLSLQMAPPPLPARTTAAFPGYRVPVRDGAGASASWRSATAPCAVRPSRGRGTVAAAGVIGPVRRTAPY